MSFIKNVQNTASKHALWKRGDSFIVGVSGGPDSICLFHTLLFLQKKYEFSLHVAHVNYGLRGTDSQKDESFVRKIAEKHKVGFSILCPKNLSSKPNEDELRTIRYAFLEQTRKKLRFSTIAVGHNKNDQAETVLLHILRGTSLRGLSAMKPKNSHIIRPLIERERKEILHYLQQHALSYREDCTNTQSLYTRNRIRNTLLPTLQKDFNPAIIDSLNRLASNSADAYDYIHQQAKKSLQFTQKEESVEVSSSTLVSLHPALFGECLRILYKHLSATYQDIHYSHIEEIQKILKSRKGKAQTYIFQGLKFVRRGDTVTITQTIK